MYGHIGLISDKLPVAKYSRFDLAVDQYFAFLPSNLWFIYELRCRFNSLSDKLSITWNSHGIRAFFLHLYVSLLPNELSTTYDSHSLKLLFLRFYINFLSN